MIIHSATFVKSSPSLKQCPESDKPEFGFIGRSNVGKSSLVNLITGNSSLAKISSSPGKTRTINHFLINDNWYMVDLPGYGYAKVPASMRDKWIKATQDYIIKRRNLICLFVLLDPRHNPQKSDLLFMEFLGRYEVPFVRIFTKSDKLSSSELEKSINIYNKKMMEIWESLPVTFVTSSVKKTGREDILQFIEETLNNL
jgi:GTP-binding protein